MKKAVEIFPFLMTHRLFVLNIMPKDDTIMVDLTSKHTINAKYNPSDPHDHECIIKILSPLSALDKHSKQDPSLSLQFAIHKEWNWFVNITECDQGVVLEVHTAGQPMVVEHFTNLTKQSTNSSSAVHSIQLKLISPAEHQSRY